MHKNPRVSLKTRSKKVLEISVILSLILHMVVFLAFKKFEPNVANLDQTDTIIEVTDIPETEQVKRPPPPAAPAVPIESEDEELLDDITIEDTDIDFTSFDEIPPPPAPVEEEDEIPPFLPLEDQPQLIGGYEALQKRVKYPEIALRAEIEGQVSVRVLISKEGIPTQPEIIKGIHAACDQAAIDAILKTRFTPAMQRDKAVAYRMIIPIRFKIK